jgi:signal transduction histidine kinase
MATETCPLQHQSLSEAQYNWGKKLRQGVSQLQAQLNSAELLQSLVQQVVSLLNVDRCYILEFGEDQQPLPIRIEARTDDFTTSCLGLTPPWELCPHLKMTQSLQPSWCNDYIADEQVISSITLYNMAQEFLIRGLIACPILAHSKLVYVLVIHSHLPMHWHESELFLVQALSEQAALCQMQIAQSHQQQGQDTNAPYQTLYEWEKKTREALYSIRQSLNTDEVFTTAIDEMARVLRADRAFIIEFDGDKVCPIRFEYRSNESVKPFTGLIPPWDFCPYLEKTAQQEMAWSADTFNDLAFAGNAQWHQFSRYYTIRSIVASPLIYKRKLMNVLVFHTLEPKHWTEQELRFIEVLTDELSNIFYEEKVRLQHLRMSEFKNDFLTNISHELRTPLNSIMGYSKMLEKEIAGPLNEKQTKYIEYVSKGGEQLLRLINDLLDLSKIEAGKMNIYPEPTNILSLMDEVRPMVAEQAKIKNLNLVFHVQPDMTTVEVDPYRLNQILLNLLSNAIKFTPVGGSVTVRFYIQGKWLFGEVQDTGIGIPKQRLPELFQRFNQIDSATSKKHEGTGLGLLLSKEFIELQGGDISVESEEGVGTTFTFRLPVVSKLTLLEKL